MNIEKDIKVALVKGNYGAAKKLLMENERDLPVSKYQKLYSIINNQKIRSDKKYNSYNSEYYNIKMRAIFIQIGLIAIYLLLAFVNKTELQIGFIVVMIAMDIASLLYLNKFDEAKIKYIVSKRYDIKNKALEEKMFKDVKNKPLLQVGVCMLVVLIIAVVLI